MKKTLKKALSLILAAVAVLTLSLSAFAAISLDEAKAIALKDAGLTEAAVRITEARLDEGRYDIDFISGKISYDYEISKDGEITSLSVDYNNRVTGGKVLSTADAKAAAIKGVGINEADASSVRAEYDREDNDYEVSFKANGREYDVTVSAVDGSVLEYDWELAPAATNFFLAFIQAIINFFKNLF